MLPEVHVITDRDRVRSTVKSLLGSLPSVRDRPQLPPVITAPFPRLPSSAVVDVLSLLAPLNPPEIPALRAESPRLVVIGCESDADAVLAALEERIPVYILELLTGQVLGRLLGRRGSDTDIYARIARYTAERVRWLLENRGRSERLTRRQAEVLRLMLRGYSNPEIGGALEIRPKTVKNHLTQVYGKLGLSGRGKAMDMLPTRLDSPFLG